MGGGGDSALLQGWQFHSQMYFYYTNRGAHIYLAPDCNTPCSATVFNGVANRWIQERKEMFYLIMLIRYIYISGKTSKLFGWIYELIIIEMFYLTMHSTHFIYGYIALDIWYRTTNSGSRKGDLLLSLHGLLFPISSKGSVICTIPQTG